MAQPNLINLIIPAADLQDIQTALNTLTSKLAPHLISLSANERKEIPKMGDKTQAFVGKAREYASQNPDLVPNYLDVGAFEVDWQAVELLSRLQRQLAPLADNLSDSLALSGSEAYQAALIFYRNIKMAARAGVPNAKTIEADLSNRFPGSSARASTSAEPA
ncbi:MAG TPA: hypothetical protein PK011_02840 [Marinagarivorans sp.]|nr:hypothetical protein [Marinagarivorans sp.]HNG61991.1 hypothetical protein [Cellvibrionaceae bacterium]